MLCYLKSFDGKYISMSPNDLSTRKFLFGSCPSISCPQGFLSMSVPSLRSHFQVKISESPIFFVGSIPIFLIFSFTSFVGVFRVLKEAIFP